MTMIWVLRILEISYGLALFVFGVDGFLKKMRIPEPTLRAKNFLIALEQTGYLMLLVKWIEIICGLMLVFEVFPFLALIILSPVILNIFLFQIILNESRSKLGWILLLIHSILIVLYSDKIKILLI